MDCHKSVCRHSWCPGDEAQWRWGSSECPRQVNNTCYWSNTLIYNQIPAKLMTSSSASAALNKTLNMTDIISLEYLHVNIVTAVNMLTEPRARLRLLVLLVLIVLFCLLLYFTIHLTTLRKLHRASGTLPLCSTLLVPPLLSPNACLDAIYFPFISPSIIYLQPYLDRINTPERDG